MLKTQRQVLFFTSDNPKFPNRKDFHHNKKITNFYNFIKNSSIYHRPIINRPESDSLTALICQPDQLSLMEAKDN